MIHWEATDQFGNLYIGTSSALHADELEVELAEMLERLGETTNETIVLTVDAEYGQITGPRPEHARYVLNVPLLTEWLSAGQSAEHVVAAVAEMVGPNVLVAEAE